MPPSPILIKKYDVFCYGWPSGHTSVAFHGHAHIIVWDPAIPNKVAGFITFVDAGVSIPTDVLDTNGTINIYLPAMMFETVVGMLRNERRMFLSWTPNNNGMLSTS